ncbi:hypothetical protein ACFY0G_32345 [Streptomyces sp. NPDC001552]|uniref:hypothetical protein n=1 Tax=Streptomyces sp. NPDC001552 TaxID=3364587 RepID=UPI0036C9C664
MPSPNGYFDCAPSSNIGRNWYRARITHDTSSPPWDTPNTGSYEFEINIGTAALGPFTPAAITSAGNECTTEPDNLFAPNGVADSVFGVGGPAALLAGTDYWLEIVLRDPNDVEVDRFVCGPTRTEAYPEFGCQPGAPTQTSADITLGTTTGQLNVTDPCNQDSVVWELATVSGGPYTAAPSEPVTSFSVTHSFTGLTPGTQYFARARFTEQAQTAGEYLVTDECPFLTAALPGSTSMFQPQPCNTGGAGDTGADVEQTLLCDVLPDGSIAGTALAVYEYDETGTPVGAPTFVDPATGDPYVAQGILQPCPGDVGCGQPTQFCFQSSGQVEQPGRMFDTTLNLAQGFAVQGLVRDLVDTPLNIIWEVTDPDGTQFAAALQTALQSQFPGQSVTVTPGVIDPCGGTSPFTVHIECLRLDQSPPELLQFRYNAGRDLVQNPSFNTTPPTAPTDPLTFVKRADVVGGGGTRDVLCTSVANRGWETNDNNLTFELWGIPPGSPQNVAAGTTPTPRGTAVQEINSFGSGPVPVAGPAAGNPAFGQNPDTIWQTFNVPAAGNFTVRLVVGGRAGVEAIPIRLSSGDVGDAGIGDVINTTVNAGKVTTEFATPGGPWTTFSQTVPLAAGTYTLAFTGPTQQDVPGGNNAFGGLFTDMRVFQDAPNTILNFASDDDTCTVETTETSTVCEFWAPRCAGGDIVGWYNVADGEELTNAQFWAQVPAPTCCSGASGDGSSSVGNLVYTYNVCGTLNGETRTMARVVVSDQSGGIIADSFVDTDGGPVTPDTWQAGECTGAFEDSPICYTTADDTTPRGGFRREQRDASGASVVSFLGDNGAVVTPAFWRPGDCTADTEIVVLCDDGTDPPTPFLRRVTFEGTGFPVSSGNTDFLGLPYVLVGNPVQCDSCAPLVLGDVCVTSADLPGQSLPAVAVRACDGTVEFINPATGVPWPNTTGLVICPPDNTAWEEILCDDGNGDEPFRRVYNLTPLGSVVDRDEDLDGLPYVVVGDAVLCQPEDLPGRDVEQTILCDNNGAFLRRYEYNDQSGLPSGVPSDFTLAGAPYVTVGPVVNCGASSTARDEELLVLCDATPTRFLRRYNYDAATGALIGIVNTTLDGATPFAPVGAVGVCTTAIASDFDFLSTVLCDSTGTQFIQRLTFNSATGAVVSTTNTTLTGGAFVPVAPVSLCSNCCPQVIGEGCTNTGSGFYTAIRSTTGTISLIDSVTGAAVLAANIIPCPSDDTARTLTAQARQLTNATPWTPGGDVAGTLTSLTVTGLSGLWDLVDQNGTVLTGLPAGLTLTWGAEDDNVLTGPQSVTPQAGASVVANWTQR